MKNLLERSYAGIVAWILARRGAALGLLLALLLPALVLTGKYFADIHAELQELLPASAPAVIALKTIHERLGGKANLTIIATSPDPKQNHAFVDELTTRLENAHIAGAKSIQGNVRTERAWIQDHAAILVDRKQFDSVMDDVEHAVSKSAAEASNMDFDDGTTAAQAWEALGKRLQGELKGNDDKFANGYLETPDGKMAVIVIWMNGSDVDVDAANVLLEGVRKEVAAVRDKYGKDLVVAFNGEVPNLVEEHDAILADLSLSTLMVFVLVVGLIAYYFRSMRAVAAILASLAPGLLCTFAIGRLSGSTLNSNTAFLGSIIAGNGINYPILLLAYYRARPPEEPMGKAIAEAARQALPGTLGAAATASAAYAGLAASSLKGFSQFGWLGGVGMLTTWVLSLLAMPIAIAWFAPPRKGEVASSTQGFLLRFFAKRRLPELVAAGVVALAGVASFIGYTSVQKGGLYDMELSNLRNRDSLKHGSASWDGRVAKLFGVWLNPVVGVVDDPADAEKTAAELNRTMVAGEGAPAEHVETVTRYVPPAADQQERFARLSKLKKPLKHVPDSKIPEKARPYVKAWLAPENLKVITADDAPKSLVDGFLDLQGRRDRTVLLYPSLAVNYNDGNNVIRFADRLRESNLPKGTVVGGAFLFMAEIIRMVRDEAPKVVLLVCLLVALALVPIFFRKPGRIPLVVGTVAIVAVSAQLVMFAFGVRLNMLNFAAVPITIGVGADYVVNLLGAMDAFSADARRACARMGGAILLCSMTTVVGYTSLLVAQSGALRSFGQAAVLGEVMAVITVLVILPVVYRTKVPTPEPIPEQQIE